MSPLSIELREQKTAFRPGEEISGTVFWKLEQAPAFAALHLFWLTQGKGSEDVQVAGTLHLPNPKPEEARPFLFRAPESPYSFSGKLISLVWGLELVLEPGGLSTRVTLTISPTGKEIVLPQQASAGIGSTPKKKWGFTWGPSANT